MKNLLLSAVLALGATAFMAGNAEAKCQKTATVQNCGVVVPDVQYDGGGVDVLTYPATACFEPQMAYDITLKNGRVELVGAFVYSNQVNHEKVDTYKFRVAKRGDPVCWSHNAAIGAYMAVYVTCKTYTGWVAGKFTGKGTVTMVPRPDWNWKPKWM